MGKEDGDIGVGVIVDCDKAGDEDGGGDVD